LKIVDLKNSYKVLYEKYKALIGSATAQQILNKCLNIIRG